MKVHIPQPLHSYTGETWVEADGTLAELLLALDRRFPGLRLRIVNELTLGNGWFSLASSADGSRTCWDC